MAHSRLQRRPRYPWLLWIQLPRMNVKHARLALPVHASQRAFRNDIRQQTKVASSSAGPVTSQKANGSDRNFQKIMIAQRVKREPRPLRYAVVVVHDGVRA